MGQDYIRVDDLMYETEASESLDSGVYGWVVDLGNSVVVIYVGAAIMIFVRDGWHLRNKINKIQGGVRGALG